MDAQTAEALLTVAETIAPALRGAGSKAAIERLEGQYRDLQLALEWFIDRARADDAFRLGSALVGFWMATKRLDDGSVWFDRALALPGGDDAHRGRALFDAGYLAFWKGDDARSSALQDSALEAGRRSHNSTIAALALVGLARIALRGDRIDEARRLCREAIAETEGTSDRLGRSSAMHVLGVAAQMAGDFLEARDVMRRRIALAREQENLFVVSSEAGNLSMVERQLGNLDEAEALAAEALEIDRRRGDDMAIPWKVNGLAAIARDRGQFERAATLVGIAAGTMEASGGAWPPDERKHYDQTVADLVKAMGSAEFERLRAAGRAMTTSEAVTFALGTRTGQAPCTSPSDRNPSRD
jgi:tetratricopeptide (TPR) repeat protein